MSNQKQKKVADESMSSNIFLPISGGMISWEFFVLLYITADFVLTIMVQCFRNQDLNQLLYHYFDAIMPFVLLLDILLSFNTCYIKNGVVIYERKTIAIEYLKSKYFTVDVLSFIFSILQLSFHSLTNYNPAFNFFVFIKIIKVYKFNKNIKRYALKSFTTLLMYEIAKGIFFLALINHIIGCYFFYLDLVLIDLNWYSDQDLWVYNSFAYANIISQSLGVQYTYSFYFSTSILSGIAYGDLVPMNPTETVYVCFVLILPIVIYSYIFNSIYSVISKQRVKDKEVKRVQMLAKQYFKALKVRQQLQYKLITYLTYAYSRSIASYSFTNDLAPSVKNQYLVKTNESKFNFKIFDQMVSTSELNGYEFKVGVMGLIHETNYPERFKLVSTAAKYKVKNRLYYINSGTAIRLAYTDRKYGYELKAGDFINFHSFLTALTPQKVKYQTTSFFICQYIDQHSFLRFLKHPTYRKLQETYFLLRQQLIFLKNATIVGQNCFFCDGPGHSFDFCHYLRPKIELDEIFLRKASRKRCKRIKIVSKKHLMNGKQEKGFEKQVMFVEQGCQFEEQIPTKKIFPLRCLLNRQFENHTSWTLFYPEYNI